MTVSVKKIASVACLAFLACSAGNLWAADSTRTIQTISEAGAQQALTAAEHEAEKLHAPCAIAVVDASGTLVAFVKMDGVRSGSPELAIGKARTSALLERPSAETENNVDNGRAAFMTSGLMTLRGGEPLKAGTQVVGAIGVAGFNKDNDVAIAQAAAAVFAATTSAH
jgi:glc operon protein GlcG